MNLLETTGLPLFWNLWMLALTLGSLVLFAMLALGSLSRAASADSDEREGDGPMQEHRINGVRQPDTPAPRAWGILALATLAAALILLLGAAG
ncbi:hypothetical protein [Cobetia sp. 1AS1]|uniref:hypothetical protein n=1 Tax=Cobetia sp. 1AS1 TaxID=3040016 RepID=UPI00244A9F72|nr:hypothetical protein [Cobetia sp. 1AS1]MDH2295066.1 hypothetical protein [Cobetia sp. 1AS1]